MVKEFKVGHVYRFNERSRYSFIKKGNLYKCEKAFKNIPSASNLWHITFDGIYGEFTYFDREFTEVIPVIEFKEGHKYVCTLKERPEYFEDEGMMDFLLKGNIETIERIFTETSILIEGQRYSWCIEPEDFMEVIEPEEEKETEKKSLLPILSKYPIYTTTAELIFPVGGIVPGCSSDIEPKKDSELYIPKHNKLPILKLED